MDNQQELTTGLSDALFLNIFKSFKMAIHPSKLTIAFVAIAAIFLVGSLMDEFTTVETLPGLAQDAELMAQIDTAQEQPGPFTVMVTFTIQAFHHGIYHLFRLNLPGVAGAMAGFAGILAWAFRFHPIFTTIYILIELAILAAAGGAICRIAALQLASSEKPSAGEAWKYGKKNFISFFTAPLAPIGIILAIGLFIFILGLLGNIPYIGELLVGIGTPLVLAASALIALAAVGLVVGFMLLYPAVAYDGSDAFDAISRAFSYIYTRPWRTAFYVALAAVYGALCYIFVRFMAYLVLLFSYFFLQLGVFTEIDGAHKLHAIWPEPSLFDLMAMPAAVDGPWTVAVAAFIVRLCVLAVAGLVAAFVTSFFFSASTVIYALLRKMVDNTDISEVYSYQIEETPAVPQGQPAAVTEEPQQQPQEKPQEQSKDQPGPESDSEKGSDQEKTDKNSDDENKQ